MSTPKHIVAVSAYVTNSKNEVLLVKTHPRDSDTWELPGGQVDEGESLSQAVRQNFGGNGHYHRAKRRYRRLLQHDERNSR